MGYSSSQTDVVARRELSCARSGADQRKERMMKPYVDIDECDHIDDSEAGMATAEYAIGTVAATSFGGLLVWILDQPWIKEALENIFRSIFEFL